MNKNYQISLSRSRPLSRILVADRNELIIFAFRKLLSHHPHLSLVGYSNSGLKAIDIFRKTQPTLLVVDLNLKDMSGIDFIKRAKYYNSEIQVVAYLSSQDEQQIESLERLGVNSILDKNTSVKNIFNAIHNASIGINSVFNKEKSRLSIQKGIIALPQLTPREKQILKFVAEGRKNKEIASLLFLSIKTVQCHRFNLMKKLNAHHVVDVINWARRFNII